MTRKIEIWKDVKGYEGRYLVSNTGEISNIDGQIIKQETTQKGYKRVRLYKDGDVTNCKVHRLVAEAFIPNPYHLPQVNHINEDKTNNNASNLCWVDNRTNNRLVKNRNQSPNPVTAYGMNGKRIADFVSVTAASRMTGIDRFGITASCEGTQKRAGGYIWRYATE